MHFSVYLYSISSKFVGKFARSVEKDFAQAVNGFGMMDRAV